ncbi:MAG: DUF1015 domain-containing protein [Mangrovibacterium sp.]
MATIKPFRGLRPPTEIAAHLSCLPYDVMNSAEAAEKANDNDISLLHITHAEIDCPEGTDIHSNAVYQKAKDNFEEFQNEGLLIRDENAKFYIYAQGMDGRIQYGIVGLASCEDYENGIIKKHELTRPDKEEDRMILTQWLDANIEPVFFSFKAVDEIDNLIARIVENQVPAYDFIADDGFLHQLWTIDSSDDNSLIEECFKNKIDSTYIADGHHRTAAAARIGLERKKQNPNHNGSESYNFFMAVHFPDNQLQIMDYNRVIKDLNGLSSEEFILELEASFYVEQMGKEIFKPSKLHEFSLYIDNYWYKLNAKEGTFSNDPIGVLDVTVLSNQVLEPILDITDLRTSKRIDFVGGIRGLGELKRRVDSGEMKAAFALYPVSMQQLIDIADSGNIMPPKTTWFEPKLRSGLVINSIKD